MFNTSFRPGLSLLAVALFSCLAAQACCVFSIDSGSSTDSNFTGGVAYTAVPLTPPGTADMTVRYGTQFTYSIPSWNLPYVVTFHFLETTVQSVGARVFSVSVNDQPVIKDLDIFASCGFMQPCSRSALLAAADEMLNIVFTASVRNAMVSSIDLVQLGQIFATQGKAP